MPQTWEYRWLKLSNYPRAHAERQEQISETLDETSSRDERNLGQLNGWGAEGWEAVTVIHQDRVVTGDAAPGLWVLLKRSMG